MAEIKYYNTKVQSEVVGEDPVFQAHVKTNGSIGYDELLEIAADRLKDTKASIRATIDTFGEVIKENLKKGYRCTWDGICRFEISIEGSFGDKDAPWLVGRNKLIVSLIAYDDMRKQLSDITPKNMLSPADVRILGLQDATTMGQDEYVKGHTLLVQGVGLEVSQQQETGEGAFFRKADGTEIGAAVSDATDTTLDCSCNSTSLVPGDYTFVVKSRAKNAGNLDYTLVEATRAIKVIAG